jgi:hypothetical protein
MNSDRDFLIELRKTITERMDWQEKLLKEEWGKGWVVMLRTQDGSGYELCEELGGMIDKHLDQEEASK